MYSYYDTYVSSSTSRYCQITHKVKELKIKVMEVVEVVSVSNYLMTQVLQVCYFSLDHKTQAVAATRCIAALPVLCKIPPVNYP